LTTLHKKEKIKKAFSQFNPTLTYKRPSKLLLNNKSLKFKGGFLKHHNIHTEPLNTHAKLGKLET
jgi:hypothetical protein